MARPEKKRIEVAARESKPLQQGAFSALDSLIDPAKLASAPFAPANPAKAAEPVTPKRSLGRVVLRRETKDRGGKTVVIVSGFRELPDFNAVKMADLARSLRNKLGCGGSFDRHEIILQGDRPADVTRVLTEIGFRVDGVTS